VRAIDSASGVLEVGRRPTGRVVLALAAGATTGIAVVLVGPTAALLLFAGIVGVIVAARWPGVLLAAYLLIPFYKAAVRDYTPIDLTVVLAVLNTLQVIPVIRSQRVPHVSYAAIVLWVALAILVFAGVLYAPDQTLAFSHAATYWALVFVPILPAALRAGSDPRHIRQFLWTLFGMGVLTVVLGLSSLSGPERLSMLGANTINSGLVALLVPILGVTFVFGEQIPLVSAATVVLVPAAIVVELASGSRGPLLALIALGVIAAMRSLGHPRSINWRLAGIVAGLACASLVVVSYAAGDLPRQSISRFGLLGDFVQTGMSGDLDSQVGDTSAAARVTLWGLAVSLFEDHPVLGVGTAGFEAVSPWLMGPGQTYSYPHNALLQVAAELGLLGVGVTGSLVLLALTRRLLPSSQSRALRSVLVFLLLETMLSGDIFSDRTTWGLVMLVLLMDVPLARGPAETEILRLGRISGTSTVLPEYRVRP